MGAKCDLFSSGCDLRSCFQLLFGRVRGGGGGGEGLSSSAHIDPATYWGWMWVYLTAMVYALGNGAFISVDYALALDTLPDVSRATQSLGRHQHSFSVLSMRIFTVLVGVFALWTRQE